jgi:hypothetical protein
MDKQIIEEMVLAVYPWLKQVPIEERKQLSENVSGLMVMERLYNAGYRKIHENAVVLMGTETEQRFEDLMVAFDEMGFMPNTTHPFPEEYVETWKQRLIFVFGQLRKETAEKFAKVFKTKLFDLGNVVTETDIDEICKEIIGEV